VFREVTSHGAANCDLRTLGLRLRFAYWVNEPHPYREPDNTKYDLVVGDKVYIRNINDQSSPDTSTSWPVSK
jgi:hypothetical protein